MKITSIVSLLVVFPMIPLILFVAMLEKYFRKFINIILAEYGFAT